MNNHELDEIEAALNELDIQPAPEGEQVLPDITQDQILSGYGLLKGDSTSRTLVGSKMVHRSADAIHAEREARTREQARKRQQRRRQQANRVKRQEAVNVKPVDALRMAACLALLGQLVHVITNLTLARYNRFRRVLGDVMVEDIAQDALIRIAEALSKSKEDLVDLARATMWLATAPQPYVAADGPDGSRRLLGTIQTVIGRTITDAYRANTTSTMVETINEHGETVWERKDTTLLSFELLETIAHSTHTDVDDMLSHVKAKDKGMREGSEPGMREKRQFARMIIDAAIRARGLDWLATMMLDPERVRTDGSFKWQDNADTIWSGLHLPPLNTDSAVIKASYAKRAVVIAFGFLPEVIEAAYNLVNDPVVMFYLNARGITQMVASAAPYRPCNYEGAQTYAKVAMDGGTSLERSIDLMDDPTKARRALAVIEREEA